MRISTKSRLLEGNIAYDRQLLTDIAAGDEQAFAHLYHHYYQQLRPFIWKLTQSATTTDEIIQETFIRVWLYRDRLPEIENFRAWLFKVASRENLSWLRKQLPSKNISAIPAPDPKVFTPIQFLQGVEVKGLVQQAVANLSEQRRRVFQLSREQGLSANDIAAQLGLSPQTVHNTLSAALRQIREHLEAAGYVVPSLIAILLVTYPA